MESGLHGPSEPRLLSAVIASAMDAILVIDADQRIVLFNPAAAGMFGCAADEAIGWPLSRFLPSRFHTAHLREVGHFLQTGETARAMGHLQHLAALRADGNEFPIEATIAQVEIDDAVFGLAIVRDITARVETEIQLLRQAEQLDLAYDAIFTWAWDGPILTWNRGAERLYGYSAAEAVGRYSHELLKTAHGAGFAEMRQALEQDGTWEGELQHIGRDGREIVVDSRHVLVRDGAAPYVLEVNRDVTERKRIDAERSAAAARAAAASAEAEANALQRDRLRDILEGFPGGVEILGRHGDQIEFANSGLIELIFGHRNFPTGILPAYGRDFSFCRADGTPLPGPERPGQRALRGERVNNQQLEMIRADGSRLPVAAYAAPLRDRSGVVGNAIVVIQDVTLVRQAEQVKDDFLALISHEFRTPLTSIHGGAHLLTDERTQLDETTRSELLADIVIESERLDQMLTNLLTLTNVMAGRLPVTTEPVLVGPLARRAVAAIAPRAKGHQLVVDVSPSLPPIEADPDLLEQVLRNLYENAVKYAPNGGEIRTWAEAKGGMVEIHVSDQGIGIAPEHVASVFERFRRVGATTVRGMGLGLYLSRWLIETQHGRIWADSPGLGLGTTVTVALPPATGWNEDDPIK